MQAVRRMRWQIWQVSNQHITLSVPMFDSISNFFTAPQVNSLWCGFAFQHTTHIVHCTLCRHCWNRHLSEAHCALHFVPTMLDNRQIDADGRCNSTCVVKVKNHRSIATRSARTLFSPNQRRDNDAVLQHCIAFAHCGNRVSFVAQVAILASVHCTLLDVSGS